MSFTLPFLMVIYYQGILITLDVERHGFNFLRVIYTKRKFKRSFLVWIDNVWICIDIISINHFMPTIIKYCRDLHRIGTIISFIHYFSKYFKTVRGPVILAYTQLERLRLNVI